MNDFCTDRHLMLLLLLTSVFSAPVNAADVRYTVVGSVSDVGFSVSPDVAQFGDTLTMEFTGTENPTNTHPTPEFAFNSGPIYSMVIKIGDNVVFSLASAVRMTIEAPNGSNTHLVQWSGGEEAFDGLSGGAIMRFAPGFFDQFPTAASVLNPNLPAFDSSSNIGFCFNGLDIESCVSAPRVDQYTVQTLVDDGDGDGFADNLDNCTQVDNPNQTDTDADGFGNACDADVNNDCVINFIDVSLLAVEFLGTNPLFDFNDDGAVNFIDFGIMTEAFGAMPGPSGLASCTGF
ncbi:MAG: hypothetical protein AAF465_17270 [Pseudomonadota bacterium]